jgi:uncharacterized protein (DUF2249 family)
MKTSTPSTQGHSCSGGSTETVPSGDSNTSGFLKQGILDVRALPPARRHSLIFETFKGLNQGESYVLVNDHDPKPLYYQFSAEYAGLFTWAYEEQGPEVWRVRIGKAKDEKTAQS